MYGLAFGPDVETLTVKLRVIMHFISSIKNVPGLSDIHYPSDEKYTIRMESTTDFLQAVTNDTLYHVHAY